MINRIKELLSINKDVSGYLINASNVRSKELFFVRDKMEMNRAKDVDHYSLTVYKDFEEDGEKYKGSANANIYPTMSDIEIAKTIADAVYAAGFVKNPDYKLVDDVPDRLPRLRGSNVDVDNDKILVDIVNAIYACDNQDSGNINSTEIFLETTNNRIINSNGIDREYTISKVHMGIVVDYAHEDEEIELIEVFNIHHFDKAKFQEKIREMFVNAEYRAKAKSDDLPTDIPIVLRHENVREMMTYYVYKANTEAIYSKQSSAKQGDKIQGDNIVGDAVNIRLVPELEESVYSKYVDNDGVILNEVKLYKDGQLLHLYGSSRYSQYCDTKVTGMVDNVEVLPGSMIYKDMVAEDCLEILSFSDFQMNSVTGDFGGEVRLAIHHTMGQKLPLTGGSVTGNIKSIQSDIKLSREVDMYDDYLCPVAMKFYNKKDEK